MDYITAAEIAKKWHISLRQVQQFCASNKIPGVIRMGHQWMIPIDAQRPADGRFLTSRQSSQSDPYHFPCLAYSKYYAYRDELSEDELLLLDAQILNLKNEYAESIRICNELIKNSVSQSVLFGAHFTNASNYHLLGLPSQIQSCTNAMENICQKNPLHQEDFRFLLAFLEGTFDYNSAPLYIIDVAKLSPQALIAYEYLAITSSFFSLDRPTEDFLCIYKAFCKETDLMGITPLSIIMHALLALFCAHKGDTVTEKEHMQTVCKLGYESGLYRPLAKSSNVLDPTLFHDCLSKYGNAFAKKVEADRTKNVENLEFSYNVTHENSLSFSTSSLENEIVILLAYKMSIKDISTVKSIPEKEVRKIIKNLCERFSLGSKAELVEYYKKIFAPKH